jgi:hypothetical protein
MAFNNIDNLAQGNLLQIMFTNGVRNQISEDFRDFEYVSKLRVGKSAPREIRFMLQNSYGSAAVGFRNPGASQSFPTAAKASVSEKTAYMKEVAVTVEVDYNLYDRARTTPEKYLAPLALEMQSKSIAAKRVIAAAFQGDGTGVIGTAASVVDTTGSSGEAVVTLSTTYSSTLRGHVGLFEEGDLYICKNSDGTADNPTVTGTFYAWQCTEKDRDNNAVTLRPIDSTGAYLPLTASSIDSGDVFYRITQGTFADLTGSISDYGTVTEVLTGLNSLAAADGRTCWGISMSGATAGSLVNASGNTIDTSYIQQALDKAKLRAGQGAFKYKLMSMAPETQAALIQGREADRRFVQADDNKRGVKFMAFQHGNDLLECYTSEFVRKDQIWMLPEAGGKKVLELYGTDFDAVKGEDMSIWHLKPNSAGYDAAMQSFLKANMTIVATQPAAIACVANFTNS